MKKRNDEKRKLDTSRIYSIAPYRTELIAKNPPSVLLPVTTTGTAGHIRSLCNANIRKRQRMCTSCLIRTHPLPFISLSPQILLDDHSVIHTPLIVYLQVEYLILICQFHRDIE